MRTYNLFFFGIIYTWANYLYHRAARNFIIHPANQLLCTGHYIRCKMFRTVHQSKILYILYLQYINVSFQHAFAQHRHIRYAQTYVSNFAITYDSISALIFIQIQCRKIIQCRISMEKHFSSLKKTVQNF